MTEFYFDTYAIIELFKGNQNYDSFKEKTIVTSMMNLVELYYSLLLEKGEKEAAITLNDLNFEFLEITYDVAIKSSIFRHRNKKAKFSYVDCVGYNLAKENNLVFLTGDKEFEKLENVMFVK